MALRSSAGARFGRAPLAMATWRSPLRRSRAGGLPAGAGIDM